MQKNSLPINKNKRLQKAINPALKSPILGSVRPNKILNPSEKYPVERNFDEESVEIPVRSPELAQRLIHLRQNSPEAIAAVRRLVSDCLVSASGDNIGFDIAPDDRNQKPLDKNVYNTLHEAALRLQRTVDFRGIMNRILFYGDCFASFRIDLWNNNLETLSILPTWEMFRVEEGGEVVRFEQRASNISGSNIIIQPHLMCHWRYEPDMLYGQSLFRGVLDEAEKIEKIVDNIENVVEDAGLSALVHKLPCDAGIEYAKQYKQDLIDFRKQYGAPKDFFMMEGGSVEKLGADLVLDGMLTGLDKLSQRVSSQTQIPPWLLYSTYPQQSTREISGAPERAYARFINSLRDILSKELYKVFNCILYLKGFSTDYWNQYRITYPIFYVDNTHYEEQRL